MGLNKEESHDSALFLKRSFHTACLTLLTLLLPLSFLLLARLTNPSPRPPSAALLLRSLVSFLSLSSLLYSLSGQLLRPRLAVAWPFLCTLQLCVSLGIELIIPEVAKPTPSTRITSHALRVGRAVFFLGLHETMLHWSRTFVRPVVDDTVFGAGTDEGRTDRAAVGAAFCALWLWMLRDNVEPLVLAAGKEGLVAAMSGLDAFVLWFVGYTTAVIGVLRALQVVFFVVRKLLFLFLCCCGVVVVVVVGGDDGASPSFPEGAEV